MSEVATEVKREKARVQDVAFKIFAVVGFLSSIVTIISWFSSTQATLTATTTVTSLELPANLQFPKDSTSPYDLNSAVTDIENRYCNPATVDYNGTKSRNYDYNADKCSTSKVVFQKISEITKLDGKRLLAYDILVTNEGKQVAENIILRSPIEVNVKATDADGNTIKAESTSSNKVFALPNLNPKESLKLRITSATPVPEQYEDKIGSPKVSYSGGIASNREMITVSGRYSGIVAFLDDLPTVFQIIIILVAAFFITMLWLLPIGLISDANQKRKKSGNAETPA